MTLMWLEQIQKKYNRRVIISGFYLSLVLKREADIHCWKNVSIIVIAIRSIYYSLSHSVRYLAANRIQYLPISCIPSLDSNKTHLLCFCITNGRRSDTYDTMQVPATWTGTILMWLDYFYTLSCAFCLLQKT